MHYRPFGKKGFQASTLGMGCMRLPLEPGKDASHIDEQAASQMIHHAIESGVNYIDTAYPYHSGQSERVVGRALQGSWRGRVKLATKLPVWLVKTGQDFDRYFSEQQEKLRSGIDVYLLHALGEHSWKTVQKLGLIERLDRAKREGQIEYAAFSYHGGPACFREIVDAYDWDMAQVQMNLVDEHAQAGIEGLRYAAAKGISIVVMEPLKGGALVNNVPPDARKLMEQAPVRRTPQDWALRWLADMPEVAVVLSGMSNMEQLQDNLAILADAAPNSLSAEERAILEELKPLYQNAQRVGCTGCAYCLPCPSGVSIPEVFKLYNRTVYERPNHWHFQQYDGLEANGQGPSACTGCGACEEHCPQSIPVPKVMQEVIQAFRR